MLHIQNSQSLAPYTSFGIGGPAEHLALVTNSEELRDALACTLPDTPLWTLGYGSNCLISDRGLPGMTIVIRGGDIKVDETLIIADAGAWWDDVVVASIEAGLWGIELLSEVPGSVGASLFINITAYGQSIGSVVEWIEVWNRNNSQIEILNKDLLKWGYKESIFQTKAGSNYIITRVALRLSRQKTDELSYQKALDIAAESVKDINSLHDRRDIIIEARKRAGSLWHPKGSEARTVGSFFRNPIVSRKQVDTIIAFDESGKTAEQIKNMNRVHGGSSLRVSAAHVMLASGFTRGQMFEKGHVKLNDHNLLKIEALEGATAQDIYNTMITIQEKVNSKLGILLEPEARILGDFST